MDVVIGEVVVIVCMNVVTVGVCCIEFLEVIEVKLVRVEVLESKRGAIVSESDEFGGGGRERGGALACDFLRLS